MRTTVTIDPDVEVLLQRVMRERGLSFKEVINAGIRNAYSQQPHAPKEPFQTPTFKIGFFPHVNLDKANQLAGQLEDEEILPSLIG